MYQKNLWSKSLCKTSIAILIASAGVAMAQPANDSCVTATPLVIGVPVQGNMTGSTNDGPVPCAGSENAADVWYSYTSPCSGTVTVNLCGTNGLSDMDATLSALSGCPDAGGLILACNDDTCGLDSQVTVAVSANQTIYLRLSTYFGSDFGNGQHIVNTSFVSNNDCANASRILGEGQHAVALGCATTDGTTACVQAFADQWFDWTPITTGDYAIDTCGLVNFDSVLVVYNSGTCGSLQTLVCNDDFCGLSSRVCFPAIAGETYKVRVGHFNNAGNQAPFSGSIRIAKVEAGKLGASAIFAENGREYFSLKRSSWTSANYIAQDMGENLATINNAAENEFVRSSFTANGPDLWIGFNDVEVAGTFVWTSGEPVGYTNWDGGEPNNIGVERYVHMFGSSGRWNNRGNESCGPLSGVIEKTRPSIIRGPIVNADNGSVYYVLSNSNWQLAREAAQSLGGDLATVNSSEENAWIVSNCFGPAGAANVTRLWIGLTDTAQEGSFQWADGSAFTYSRWDSNEPNNGGGVEDWVLMYDNGRWNDVNNVANVPFIGPSYGLIEVPAAQVVAGPFCNALTGRAYYILGPSTWAQAQAGAKVLGGNLVTIDSLETNTEIANLIASQNVSEAWIGYNDTAIEGNFTWLDGSTSSFTRWGFGEPNNATNEDAVLISRYLGSWNDGNINSVFHSVVEAACCPADFNNDGGVNGDDVQSFFLAFEAGEALADFNGDGGIDGQDIEAFFIRFEAGC